MRAARIAASLSCVSVSPASCLAHQNPTRRPGCRRVRPRSTCERRRWRSVPLTGAGHRRSRGASQASSHSAANASQSSPWARYTMRRAMADVGCHVARGCAGGVVLNRGISHQRGDDPDARGRQRWSRPRSSRRWSRGTSRRCSCRGRLRSRAGRTGRPSVR